MPRRFQENFDFKTHKHSDMWETKLPFDLAFINGGEAWCNKNDSKIQTNLQVLEGFSVRVRVRYLRECFEQECQAIPELKKVQLRFIGMPSGYRSNDCNCFPKHLHSRYYQDDYSLLDHCWRCGNKKL